MERYPSPSAESASRISRSATPSHEPATNTIPEEEANGDLPSSLPSRVVSPDNELSPVSPIASEVDDRRAVSPVMSRSNTQDAGPLRSR